MSDQPRPRFGLRLEAAMTAHGPLCVGLDPHPQILAAWGLGDTVTGLRAFTDIALGALVGHVAAIKPQVAFYERHGSAGMAVLEEIVGVCADAGQLTIVDAKRGDIGSTMAGYADAYLREGGPFAGDSVTLSPFLGVDSLAETVQVAQANQRGVFILALTSNPEGAQVQHARGAAGVSVAAEIAARAGRWNAETIAAGTGTSTGTGRTGRMGDVGLVVGATIGTAARDAGVDLESVHGPFLAPGIGAQGATPAELAATFGDGAINVLANSSRDVLSRGPNPAVITGAATSLAAHLRDVGQGR